MYFMFDFHIVINKPTRTDQRPLISFSPSENKYVVIWGLKSVTKYLTLGRKFKVIMISLTIASSAKGLDQSSVFCDPGCFMVPGLVKPNMVHLQALEIHYVHLPKDAAALRVSSEAESIS